MNQINNMKIKVGLVVSILVPTVTMVWWLSAQFSEVNNKLIRVEDHLVDQWSKADMENWALKLKLKNQELEIPNVR